MAASAAAAPIFLLLFVTMCITAAYILLYRRLFDFKQFVLKQNKWLYFGLSLWYLAFLILPLRGGWQRQRRKARTVGAKRVTLGVTDDLRISARPAEVEERAVPGHREGDLVLACTGRPR